MIRWMLRRSSFSVEVLTRSGRVSDWGTWRRRHVVPVWWADTRILDRVHRETDRREGRENNKKGPSHTRRASYKTMSLYDTIPTI